MIKPCARGSHADTIATQTTKTTKRQVESAHRDHLWLYILAIAFLVVAIVCVISTVATPRTTSSTGIHHSPPLQPTTAPSGLNANVLSKMPSNQPTVSPQLSPQPSFSSTESAKPSQTPTPVPTTQQPTLQPVSFFPGHLVKEQNGLLLSQGLSSRIIAKSGEFVQYLNNSQSDQLFHFLPDFAATFAVRDQPDGGWIYVSNSEVREIPNRGGVGALTMDSNGQVIDYTYLLEGTTANCGGGVTPWGAMVSCEETPGGQIWQVDPTGQKTFDQPITLGKDGGNFESFAYDVRNRTTPRFFVTEDWFDGPLRRFTPDNHDWDDPWSILYGTGKTDYLLLDPISATFTWTDKVELARANAEAYFPNSEGIDIFEGVLYFVSKKLLQLYVLDLDNGTYTASSTRAGLFDGGPDQLVRVLPSNDTSKDSGETLLYFTEDGGGRAGVHCRSPRGEYLTILESSVYQAETTGLAFSPNGKHMYVAFQVDGILFDITRDDGLPFGHRTLNVQYHNLS